MKKINEKVKDIVNVHKFQPLLDFTADPAATLAAYHFTDVTSEMMAKWLDKVSSLQDGEGQTAALAGYRGVGKSHFLATFAAIVAHPELRTKMGDGHVAAAAQSLLRRRYPCILVRRGTHLTLLEELRAGIAAAYGQEANSLPDHMFDLLALVKAAGGDAPFLLLVDTAMERTERVSRDDGSLLAEMAEAVKSLNGFMGVALDDDIAGADGSNSAIVRAFTIDYLDQEHLYKIVDSFVFPKVPQLKPVLHDVYEYFREVIPSFRWSEQRFSALYPMHPAVLDVAPFVRLYVHEFALLRFAAEAGERILGRPANSLIALDEVFDSAEKELRKVEDLTEAFVAYDRLNSDVVAKIPVMQRLQAKLILKALLLLSLEGQGTTAGEISSGMLIFDENNPEKAKKTVEEIIRMFAAAMPDDVRVTTAEDGREVRYGLRVSSKDSLNKELEDAAASVGDPAVDEVVHRLFHERFNDSLFIAADGTRKNSIECQLRWRGTVRRGKVQWLDASLERSSDAESADEGHDWEVVIDRVGNRPVASDDVPVAVWKPAALTADEIDAVKRYCVLHNDVAFREAHGDQIRGIIHSHSLILERMIARVFLEDGRLSIGDFDYNLAEDARNASSLGLLLSSALEPLFESRYPNHPYFLKTLGLGEVSTLVSDLYSGSRQRLGEVQELAQTFALPLGLVKLVDGVYYPATQEQLKTLEAVRAIDAILDDKGTADLKNVYSELRKAPFGFVREAQELVLTAMVSQRMIEFVTSKGDRINQRSLDLKIIWDDIVGLARPQESSYSAKKLVKWAVAITGDDGIKDLSTAEQFQEVRESLAKWLGEWDSRAVLGRFNSLPEESLNTRIWRSVGRSSKTLGSAAALIRKSLENALPVDECLGRISELFLDDLALLDKAIAELEVVRLYLDSFAKRAEIRHYLALTPATEDEVVEQCRESLFQTLSQFEKDPTAERDRQIGYTWDKFQRAYTGRYTDRHDSVMRSHQLQSEADDVYKSDAWWVFENLSDLVEGADDVVRPVFRLKAEVSELNCSAGTADLLAKRPFCRCGYDLSEHDEWETVVTRFRESLDRCTERLFGILSLSDSFAAKLSELSRSDVSGWKSAADELSNAIKSGTPPSNWTNQHIEVLRSAVAKSRVVANESTLAVK